MSEPGPYGGPPGEAATNLPVREDAIVLASFRNDAQTFVYDPAPDCGEGRWLASTATTDLPHR
jgi:hypothetical protein